MQSLCVILPSLLFAVCSFHYLLGTFSANCLHTYKHNFQRYKICFLHVFQRLKSYFNKLLFCCINFSKIRYRIICSAYILHFVFAWAFYAHFALCLYNLPHFAAIRTICKPCRALWHEGILPPLAIPCLVVLGALHPQEGFKPLHYPFFMQPF